MASLKIYVLGNFQVMLDNRPVSHFATNKVRALLAYLAVESERPHSREFLADFLWPCSTHASALGNLRYAISELRKAIQDIQPLEGDTSAADTPAIQGGLHTSRESLEFHPYACAWVDVAEFNHLLSSNRLGTIPIAGLDRAASLYRGAFLEGFSLPQNASFDEWLLLKREQYNRLMLKTLYQLADFYEGEGDYERAQHYAWRQVELEPWLEEGHQQLMRVLTLGGQRSVAIAQYETCRKLLSSELGITPSQETERIYQLVIKGDLDEMRNHHPFSMRTTHDRFPSNPSSYASPTNPRPTGFHFETGFVDRLPELERLDTCLARAITGHGQIVLIRGGPGSGKTALADEFTRRALAANPSMIAAAGACSAQSGVGDPYMPFVEILRMLTGDYDGYCQSPALSHLMVERIRDLLPNFIQTIAEQGSELVAHLLTRETLVDRSRAYPSPTPEKIDQLLSHIEAEHTHLGANQPAIYEQFTHVLLSLARNHTLLFVVDDLQWADRPTIGLLYHLGRRLSASRVLILCMYRPGDFHAEFGKTHRPLEQTIDEILIEYGDLTIDLSHSDNRQFLDAYLDRTPNRYTPDFRRQLFRYTNGSPLLVVEMLNTLQSYGEITLDDEGYSTNVKDPAWDIFSPRLKAMINVCIHHLRPIHLRLLQAASIAGPTFIAEVAANLAGVSAQTATVWLSGPLSKTYGLVEGLQARQLYDKQLSIYRFRTPLVQIYLYQQLDEVERVSFHNRAASHLESLLQEIQRKNRSRPIDGPAREIADDIVSRIGWHHQQADAPAAAIRNTVPP